MREITRMGTDKKPWAITQLFLLAAILILITWSYWAVLVNLVSFILSSEDYSYGLLIPFVVAYIIYLKWPEIQKQYWRPSWVGLLIMILGYFLYISGELLSSLYIPSVSLIVILAGLVTLLGGIKLLRFLSFPLLLLILMVPNNTWFIKDLSLHLQLISSKIASVILSGLGVPVFRQGNVLDLGVRKLEVVSACSGLRYILSLITLGIIFCYFYQRRFWKAIILVASLVPAAIIANALRVAVMGLFPALQQVGFWHSFTGLMIFIGCFGLLMIINWALDHFWPRRKLPDKNQAVPIPDLPRNVSPKTKLPYLLAALALVVIFIPVSTKLYHTQPMALLKNLDQFPQELGPWRGKRNFIDAHTLKVLGTHDYLDINYHNPENESISLWIAYYGNLDRSGYMHSPFFCLTGGGWNVLESRKINMLPGKPVNYLVMEQGNQRIVVYYWFIHQGQWVTSEYLGKVLLGYDRLFKRRADGAIVRLSTNVEVSVDSARKRLNSYAKILIPKIQEFIPN